MRTPEKSGWLAGTSVQILLSIEAIFMTAATKYDASAIENKFNTMIENGTKSVVDMEACVLANADPIELELIGNFKDFVYLCLDIKKKNEVEQQQQALQTQQQQQQQDTQLQTPDPEDQNGEISVQSQVQAVEKNSKRPRK